MFRFKAQFALLSPCCSDQMCSGLKEKWKDGRGSTNVKCILFFLEFKTDEQRAFGMLLRCPCRDRNVFLWECLFCFYKTKRNAQERAYSSYSTLTKKKVIWSAPEKFNKARRSQSKISQPHYSIKHIDVISYLQSWTSVSSRWSVIHLDQKTIWWTIPLMHWCWQLSHEIVIAGLWASSAAKTMCYQCTLWSTVCKKTETNTSKSCRCVCFMCCMLAHSHTPPLLYFTHFKIQCVILHVDAHLHTHRHVCVHTFTHTLKQFPSHFCSSSWLRCIIGHSYAIV